MRSLSILALVSAMACGGSQVATDAPAARGVDRAPAGPADGPEGATAPSRNLGDRATFEDLVATAQALDGRSEGDSDAGCLLRSSGGWRLEADLAVPVRPLPAPVPSLAQALRNHSGPVRVLSRWGQRGAGRRAVALFSMFPRNDAEVVVLFVSADGIRLRSTDGATVAGPFFQTTIPSSILDPGFDGLIAVTADAQTPLDTLVGVLGGLPEAATVTLGVLLPEETRLPEPLVADADGEAGLCPDGLEPAEGAEGQFDATAAAPALAQLRQSVGRCSDYRSGVGEAAGGLSIAFRIGPGGQVTEACATADDLGDPALRACALDAVRTTRFPDPGGVLDLALPVRFEADVTARQAVLCP